MSWRTSLVCRICSDVLKKLEDVQKLAKRREDEDTDNLQELTKELQQVAAELSGAEQRSKAVRERVEGKIVRLEDVKQACDAALPTNDLSWSKDQSPQEIVAAIVALCREKITDLDSKDRSLNDLEIAARGHLLRLAQQKQLSEQRANLDARAAELEKRESDLNQINLATQSRVRAAGRELEDLTNRVVALDGLSRLQDQLKSQRNAKLSFNSRELELQSTVEGTRGRLEELLAAKYTMESSRLELTQSSEVTRSSLEKLRNLGDSLAAYVSDTNSLSECKSRQVGAEQTLRDLHERLAVLQRTSDVSRRELLAAQQKRAELDSAQQRKNSLVASLREYVVGNECPMCGISHPTPQALVDAIEGQLRTASREVLMLAQQIETASAEARRVDSEIQFARGNIARGEKSLEVITAERASLENRIALQNDRAKTLGVVMEADKIGQAIVPLDKAFRDGLRKLEEARAEISRSAQEKNRVELILTQQEGTLAQEKQKSQTAQTEIDRLQERARNLGFDDDAIGWNPEEMVSVRRDAVKSQEAARAAKLREEDALKKGVQESIVVHDALSIAKKDLHEVVDKLERVNEEIRRTDQLCQQLGIKASDPEQAVRLQRKELADSREQLDKTQRVAERYKWSSELGSIDQQEQLLRQRHRELVEKCKILETDRSRLGKASLVVEGWNRRLRSEVTEVVERRLKTHQPEILRLFRAMVPRPYLFEEIEMRRSDSGVHLGLKYRDQVREPGEPKLFLSEAQANVLALAIFLSFACSQKWSRLETDSP